MKPVSDVWPNIVKDLLVQRQRKEYQYLDRCVTFDQIFRDFPHVVRIHTDWQTWLSKISDVELWCEEHCEDSFVNHWLEGRTEDGEFKVLRNNDKIGIIGVEQSFFYGFKKESDATLFILNWIRN